MNIVSLTQSSFDSTVAQSPCLVVEFSNSIRDFADRASNVVDSDAVQWAHVDLRTETSLAASFAIQGDSSLLIFREQVVLYLEHGKHESERIAELLNNILALDMLRIKTEIEAEKQAELALRMRRVCPTARRGPMGG